MPKQPPTALKNVNSDICLKVKVGVVGRTGAEKLAATLTISRILEAFGRQIMIDEEDIASLPLKQLRESIMMILQDDTFLDRKIRGNIVPLITSMELS